MRRCLIYEPQDLTTQSDSSEDQNNLMMTEVLVSSDTIIANVEDDSETTTRSNAQTRSVVPGEIAPEIKDAKADAWI